VVLARMTARMVVFWEDWEQVSRRWMGFRGWRVGCEHCLPTYSFTYSLEKHDFSDEF
jgi:hypothetical protein